jgi:hypothetical protein
MKADVEKLRHAAGLRKVLRDPTGTDQLLHSPIRLNKIPPGQRAEVEKDEIAKRERALFRRYYIPDDCAELQKWQWLAWALAGELFPGCRVRSKGKGGPSIRRRRELVDRRLDLSRQFLQYRRDHPYLRRQRAAEKFVEQNRKACAEAGLTDGKSFAQAMKKISTATAV